LATVERAPAASGAAEGELAEYSANARFVAQLEADLSGHRFDFIYERYSLFGTTGLELARRWGLPLFVEVNAPLVDEARAHRGLVLDGLAREVAERVFSGADQVFVVSESLRAHVLGIAPDASVSVLPNGVNPERFRPEMAVRASDRVRVGFLGRVRPWHGVERLVEATATAVRAGADVELRIVGECRGQQADLQRRVEANGIAERVEFVGALDPDDVPGALAELDILVAPYPDSGEFYFSPLKLYEYMAAGRAIVASDVGQISDVLEDGETALLVPPGDSDALARAIVSLAGDAETRRLLGAAARREAEEKHSWAQRLTLVEAALERLGRRGGLVAS
jgi:glycosyltransferase involved in cell wall biosynthesis